MPGDSDRPPPPTCHRLDTNRVVLGADRLLPGSPGDTRTPSRKPWPRSGRHWRGRGVRKGDPEIPASSSTSSPRRWHRFGKLWRGPPSRSGCRCSRGDTRIPPPPPCRRSRRGLEEGQVGMGGGRQHKSQTPPPRLEEGPGSPTPPLTSQHYPTQPPEERTQESGAGCPPPTKKPAPTSAQGTKTPPREGKRGTGTHGVTLPLEGRWGSPWTPHGLGLTPMCRGKLGGPSSSKRSFQWTAKPRKSPKKPPCVIFQRRWDDASPPAG